jgi:hypothetical protein
MSILPPLSSTPLTGTRLAELLASKTVTDPYLHLLRWLIWFPLLSASELTRLEQSRLTAGSPQRIAAHLQHMEELGLIAHVVVNEPGWPPHQHRYYLTDIGLYVFATATNPPLSVPRLVQAYAVERIDLISRIAHINRHLVLAEFATRLIAEGGQAGYLLTSFQQPWLQSDTIFGRRQTLRLDAAFLLQSPQETEHAFYVRVDTQEQLPFEDKRERMVLVRLLNQRHALHLQQETMPRLLIITSLSRLADWRTLIETVSQQRGTALLDGAITTLDHLHRSGIYGPGWWTFAELIQNIHRGSLTNLAAPKTSFTCLRGAAVSDIMAERFSQRRSFAHLLLEPEHRPSRQAYNKPLPSYVGKPLVNEIASIRGTVLTDALSGTKVEQQEATALLNLALSATQKELIFWLTHQPLLTAHHLATLHYPDGRGIRGVQKQMRGLSALHLLLFFSWNGSRPWHERERYLLTESALRYSALREGRQVTYYLLSEDEKKRYKEKAFTIQQGTGGLFWQMQHTHGLYTCMAYLIEAAHREHIRVMSWKNAREAIRTYSDPFTHVTMQIRPDAELVYQLEGQGFPSCILVEYDRATTTEREYQAKYQTYADYLEYTRRSLPPILVITQHEQAAAQIRACVDSINAWLPVVIILEEHIQRRGLLAMLTQLDHSL